MSKKCLPPKVQNTKYEKSFEYTRMLTKILLCFRIVHNSGIQNEMKRFCLKLYKHPEIKKCEGTYSKIY